MFSSASITGFGVEEAVQQPGGVQHVDHKHPEQQFSDGVPLTAAVRRLGQARWEHGRLYTDATISTTNKRNTSGLG